jgi:hypothetical protein
VDAWSELSDDFEAPTGKPQSPPSLDKTWSQFQTKKMQDAIRVLTSPPVPLWHNVPRSLTGRVFHLGRRKRNDWRRRSESARSGRGGRRKGNKRKSAAGENTKRPKCDADERRRRPSSMPNARGNAKGRPSAWREKGYA